MIRLQTYATISTLTAIAVIYHAFNSRGQFYPAMVYLSTSKISLVLLLNMCLVLMCVVWQIVKKVFLGRLREAEVERLNEQSWREVMEILFAITIFRQEFDVMFLGCVVALLMIKGLHWLGVKRVEYIETTPSVSGLSHVRIVGFLVFLFVVDVVLMISNVKTLVKSWSPSVALFFAFEYMILATSTVSTFVKYIFFVTDMFMEGQWERKAVYTFYLELIRDLLHLTMYLCFFFVIFINYGVPLHLIRELYETFRNFKIRVADYVRYRKMTSNTFPDATPEEIDTSDATCIICREEMVTAKKLICGHLFHVHCLRSWLERQNTCPTCRANVIPTDNGAAGVRGQHGVHPPQLQGAGAGVGAAGTSSQQSAVGDGLSQHNARLKAAAAAAAIYEKSFVYPSPNTFTWSQGYALVPTTSRPPTEFRSLESNGQTTAYERAHLNGCEKQIEDQQAFLRQQIEILQKQLQQLEGDDPDNKEVNPPIASNSKGKEVASSSSSSVSEATPQKDDGEVVNKKL